ncbi:RNA polymerase sigma factor [Algimonas porphyrae]|uniref:RNA polymerase sigma factor n=1 Tax=Algimonas porphyrae TaxID=1128113 RepID=A0ABQ5V335_9PROT|nr:sigma-70 family RNA polymerase sigma factor [Algimonas porphyrae]GLQ21119.1 RNA polymerase sigma factor [Algimonas porphyrae]
MTSLDKHQALNEQLQDCLALCAAGNSDAFAKLYTLTASKFLAILLKMIPNEAECADVLQDAYLSIWHAAHRYDPAKGKPFTWMLVITRNKALDRLRKQSRDRAVETLSTDLVATLKDESNSPHDDMQVTMLRDLLVPHISKLKPHVAKAVIMSAIEGSSAREIGEHFGVSTNTAKSWIRRGLQRVRTDFERSPAQDRLYKLIN